VKESAAVPVIDFATYYRRETRWSSVLLFAYIGLNFLLSFTYRHWLLGLPSSAPAAVWALEWGVIIPACAATVVVRWRWSEADWAEWMTLGAVGAIAMALVIERAVWIGSGAPFFSVLNCYFLTAAMVTTGIRCLRVCAIAFPVLIIETSLSYSLYGWSPAANFDLLSFVTAAFILSIAGWQVERAMRHAWSEGRYFETLSQRDGLTGLMNRRGFDERARRLAAMAVAQQRDLALAVLDLDSFKHYNDSYGHPAGDRALVLLAQLLARFTKGSMDFAARIGGEEFVILWFDAPPTVVRGRAEDLIRSLRRLELKHERSSTGILSVSIGAHHVPGGEPMDLDALMQAADDNLYLAKQNGGDRCVVTLASDKTAPVVA
jgi:diguanylate cyclase (GGDEF)-like protein